jgi:UDP-N-acetylglucosamine:LPS N-acetylglucosamine transferase
LILQQELTPERLAAELIRLLDHPGEIDRMEEASRKLGRADAAGRAVDLAMEVAAKRSSNLKSGD